MKKRTNKLLPVGLTMDEWCILRNFILNTYENYGFTPTDVAILMDRYADKFDIVSMYCFLRWATVEGYEDGWIMAQIGHDLAGMNTSCFSPRTEGYSGQKGI